MTATQHLLSVAEYMTLEIESRTELLGGIVYDLSPKNEPHIFAVGIIDEALRRGLGGDYAVRIESPIAVSGWSGNNAPEIDVAVVAKRKYVVMPNAADAYAFIEVSDTTYGGERGDRTYKIPLYLSAGVPSWIVNVPRRQVEYYGSCDDLALEYGRVYAEGETFYILGVSIDVARLF